MYNNAKIVAAAGLVAVANGHMYIKSPQPFTFVTDPNSGSNAGQTNPAINRPLSESGSDFPCRYVAGGWDGPVNSFALGSKQTLELVGSAVHGGGSCQLSITYDAEPTKSSVWKVIHTVQGGCPARNTPGNIGNDASAADPFTYDYTIPSDIPTGNATIAWSWINRIGNREFYMNCGRLALTGNSGDKANFDKLPDLFVANIPSVSSCSTNFGDSNDEDIVIPDPGDSVEINTYSGVKTTTFNPATCTVAARASGGSGGGSQAYSSGQAAATSAGSGSGAASSPAAGGVFLTQTTGGSAATTTAAAADTTAAAPTTTAAAASAGSGSTGSTGGVKSGSCGTDGTYYCAGSSFQQCASGAWSVPIQMAAGTSCTPGESQELAIKADRKMMRGRRI